MATDKDLIKSLANQLDAEVEIVDTQIRLLKDHRKKLLKDKERLLGMAVAEAYGLEVGQKVKATDWMLGHMRFHEWDGDEIQAIMAAPHLTILYFNEYEAALSLTDDEDDAFLLPFEFVKEMADLYASQQGPVAP